MLQIIHDLITRQHIVCINTTIFHCIITNSTRTRGAKYSHPVLVTLCIRTSYQTQSLILTIEYLLHQRGQQVLITVVSMRSGPLVSSPKIPRLSPLRRNFWRMMMTPSFGSRTPTDSPAFMSTIWRGMKKIFKGQVRLRKQVEEQTTRLDRIEECLRRSQSAGPSTTAGPSRRRR